MGGSLVVDIKSKADWWQVLNDHWADILECAANAGANLRAPEPQFQELADLRPFVVFLEKSKADRNEEVLCRFVQRIWSAAPDRASIHSWPSWDVLCELCSEQWVFEPEPDENEVVHLLPTRGNGVACGTLANGVRADTDINRITCEACLKAHGEATEPDNG